MKHERQQIDLGDKDAMVVFDLNAGRRNVPLEASQLAGAVQRQQDLSHAVMGEQISGLQDPRALPPREQLLLRNRALGLGGAVGYQPIIMFLQPGTNFAAQAVISADRRYVRVTSVPSFSQIGDVTTFTFAGAAQQNTGGTGGGTGGGGGGSSKRASGLLPKPARRAARPGCPFARASGWRPAARPRFAGRRSLRR